MNALKWDEEIIEYISYEQPRSCNYMCLVVVDVPGPANELKNKSKFCKTTHNFRNL
jgi:hypothetical protein